MAQPLVDQPELLQQPLYAAQAAAAFWKATNINAKADADDVAGVTRLVNGGVNGLDGRTALLKTAKTVWTPSLFGAVGAATPSPPPPAPSSSQLAPSSPASTAAPGTKLSRYFTLETLTFSDTATRLGIDNTPSQAAVTALTDTATRLDPIQDLLGHPLQIVSGYRSAKLNSAMGGAAGSAHLTGHAVDFICRAFGSPLQICQKIIAAGIKFDQLVQEGTWVHISFDPAMRNQVLTATYTDGKTSYSSGLH
jgi:putative chitinase